MRAEISSTELDAMEARCNKATEGPWKSFVEERDHTSGSDFIMTAAGTDIELSGASIADQNFIASSREDVPRLIQAVRRLRALV